MILFLVAMVLIHVFVGTVFIVDGRSMDTTLANGEWLFVNKISYLKGAPARGDIVVLKFPGDPIKRKFVKRIIGLPGERIEVKSGAVFIDGKKLIEVYLRHGITTDSEKPIDIKLGPKEYFTMGDNRPASNDSRVFGSVPRSSFIGRAKLILLPLGKASYIPPAFY